jgi:hypothetical protein
MEKMMIDQVAGLREQMISAAKESAMPNTTASESIK